MISCRTLAYAATNTISFVAAAVHPLNQCPYRLFTVAGSTASSTSSASSSSNLKTLLRRLYLKVHPDLFEGYHQERSVNTISFVALNDYLIAIRKGDKQHIQRKPINIKFYFHPINTSTEKEEEDELASDTGFGITTSDSSTTSSSSSSSGTTTISANPQPALSCVSFNFKTDLYSVSTSRLSSLSTSRPIKTLTAAAKKQIHDNLTNMFQALGITDHLLLGDKIISQDDSAGTNDSDQSDDIDDIRDDHISAAADDISLFTFLASLHDVAMHRLESQQLARNRDTLRLAQLRLQGIRSIFQSKEGEEIDTQQLLRILDRFYNVIKKIPSLSIGINMIDGSDDILKEEHERRDRERKHAEERMMRHEEEMINQQPNAHSHSHSHSRSHGHVGYGDPSIGISNPMGRSAAMPFSRLMQQIRRAAGEDTAEESQQINPLTRTVTVFSLEAEHSHIDNRGRLVNKHNRPSLEDIPMHWLCPNQRILICSSRCVFCGVIM